MNRIKETNRLLAEDVYKRQIQKEAGEFGDMTLEQTEAWFLQEYGDRKEELSFRCLFAESMDKEADGVCMAWTEAGTDGSLIPSLHWLAVRDAKKGQGIGTALVREALRVFAGRGEAVSYTHLDVYKRQALWSHHGISADGGTGAVPDPDHTHRADPVPYAEIRCV